MSPGEGARMTEEGCQCENLWLRVIPGRANIKYKVPEVGTTFQDPLGGPLSSKTITSN